MHLSQIPGSPRILLYGHGLEGQSSERWFKQQFPAVQVEVYEDQNHHSEVDWAQYDLIVKSPGVPPSQIPAVHWHKVTSNFRLFMENLTEEQRVKVIGITGSKGKSTTAKFTHELLQTAGFKSTIVGNFGVPALDIWDRVESLDYVVAECSSFQLYDLEVSPHWAIFLSFFPDHLDWHNGESTDYLEAKRNLWKHQTAKDTLFAPEALRPLVQTNFTYDDPQPLPSGITLTQIVDATHFPTQSTLQAAHFRQNLGTVWALADSLEIQNLAEVWKSTATNFEMIEHRLEPIKLTHESLFYNDSIATSPDAVEAAVSYFGPRLDVLIMDGQDTGLGGFDVLAELIFQLAPQTQLILLSSDIAKAMQDSAQRVNLKTPMVVETLEEAVQKALLLTAPNQVCLFSPGGKSFNRFKNYSERGRAFKDLVLNLA